MFVPSSFISTNKGFISAGDLINLNSQELSSLSLLDSSSSCNSKITHISTTTASSYDIDCRFGTFTFGEVNLAVFTSLNTYAYFPIKDIEKNEALLIVPYLVSIPLSNNCWKKYWTLGHIHGSSPLISSEGTFRLHPYNATYLNTVVEGMRDLGLNPYWITQKENDAIFQNPVFPNQLTLPLDSDHHLKAYLAGYRAAFPNMDFTDETVQNKAIAAVAFPSTLSILQKYYFRLGIYTDLVKSEIWHRHYNLMTRGKLKEGDWLDVMGNQSRQLWSALIEPFLFKPYIPNQDYRVEGVKVSKRMYSSIASYLKRNKQIDPKEVGWDWILQSCLITHKYLPNLTLRKASSKPPSLLVNIQTNSSEIVVDNLLVKIN